MLWFFRILVQIYITEISKKRYTAEKAAELLAADSDPDGNYLEFLSEDDLLSIDEDENQPILSTNSDSDDTEASLTSSESEPVMTMN